MSTGGRIREGLGEKLDLTRRDFVTLARVTRCLADVARRQRVFAADAKAAWEQRAPSNDHCANLRQGVGVAYIDGCRRLTSCSSFLRVDTPSLAKMCFM